MGVLEDDGLRAGMPAETVRELMERHPCCCLPGETVAAAARLMLASEAAALPVVEGPRYPHLVGVLTEADVRDRVTARGLDPEKTLVREVMSREFVRLGPFASLDECHRLMAATPARFLPVVDNTGTLLGIVRRDHGQ